MVNLGRTRPQALLLKLLEIQTGNFEEVRAKRKM